MLLKIKTFLNTHLLDCEVLVDVVTDVSDNIIKVDQSSPTVPADIVTTPLRPDIVVIQRRERKIKLVELTVPFESNFLAAMERKAERYSPLVADIEAKGYKCQFFSIEVGSRGIAGPGTLKNEGNQWGYLKRCEGLGEDSYPNCAQV